MSDRNKKFHQIALQSSLFKGRNDWYFCYLKAEKIAHVLTLLHERSVSPHTPVLKNLVVLASKLPSTLVHFAAGERQEEAVLAEVFALLSQIRLLGTGHALNPDNVAILSQELEHLAERIAIGGRLSPFISTADLSTPILTEALEPPIVSQSREVRDNSKGQYKRHKRHVTDIKGQIDRTSQILQFKRENHTAGAGYPHLPRADPQGRGAPLERVRGALAPPLFTAYLGCESEDFRVGWGDGFLAVSGGK
jgi:hypothetical protein